MFGREVAVPIDILAEGVPSSPINLTVSEYVEWVRSAMEKAFAFAKEKMKLSVRRQKRNYNKSTKVEAIKTHDWVWLFNPMTNQVKLGKSWSGPYLVMQVMSEVTLKIQKDIHSKSKVVHLNNVKKCVSTPTPHNFDLATSENTAQC